VFTFATIDLMSAEQLREEKRRAELHIMEVVWLVDKLSAVAAALKEVLPAYELLTEKPLIAMRLEMTYQDCVRVGDQAVVRYGAVRDYIGQIDLFLQGEIKELDNLAITDGGDILHGQSEYGDIDVTP